VAADVLNFMLFRDESRRMLLESGDSVPVGEIDLTEIELPTLLEEAFALSNEHRENGTIHAFLDTVTPATMTDVTYDGLQALLAGQMSPEEFNAAVQAAWEAAKAENLHLQPGGGDLRGVDPALGGPGKSSPPNPLSRCAGEGEQASHLPRHPERSEGSLSDSGNWRTKNAAVAGPRVEILCFAQDDEGQGGGGRNQRPMGSPLSSGSRVGVRALR
jgi:hypothetical protein